MFTLYTLALTIACCVAVAAVITSDRRGRAESTWATTSTYAVLSASCATLSTLAYAIAGPGDQNPVALIIGDISMPLALGLLLATMRRAAGARHTLIVFSIIVSTGVGITTLLAGVEVGQTVKLLTLALFSGLITAACIRGRLPRLGANLVGWSMTVYGLYCLVRIAGPAVLGPSAPTVRGTLSQGPSAIVAAVAIVLVVIGVVSIIRAAGRGGTVLGRRALAQRVQAATAGGKVVHATAISMPDLPLHRAAYGRGWAQSLSAALTSAAAEVLPADMTVGEVATGVLVAVPLTAPVAPADHAACRTALRAAMTPQLPDPAPADVPGIEIADLELRTAADLHRYARLMRRATRRAMTRQGA